MTCLAVERGSCVATLPLKGTQVNTRVVAEGAYLAGRVQWTWPKDTPMPPPTSVCYTINRYIQRPA